MKYLAKKKIDGKWRTFGSIKEGKFGPELSMKKTDELIALIKAEGDWLNFALFKDDRSADKKPAPKNTLDDFDSEIPF